MRTPARSRAVAVATAAALVLVACGGDDGGTTAETTDETTDEVGTEDPSDDADPDDAVGEGDGAAAGTDQPLAVTGTNDLVWDVEELSAPAGTIEFELTCEAAMHDLVIEETDETVAECGPEETVTGAVDLDEGEYSYICTVPGHSTMRGTLTVD